MNDSAFNPNSAPGSADVNEPVHSSAIIETTDDRMAAYLIITQPSEDGLSLTLDDVLREFSESGIVTEPEKSIITSAITAKRYNERILVVRGTRPVNGVDGVVNYRFECSGVLKAKKNERDEMDYKDLGLVQNVLSGTVIADIIRETEGDDGIDLFGLPHKAMPGRPPKFLIGKGSVLNDDGTAIIAAVDGNLKWHKDHFAVEEVLVLGEDVGSATGNVDFIGDVHIKGNVFEGFTVKSGKNIVIAGTVTNATIEAGGNIDIKMGCVNSEIISKGSIKAGFCESSKIECGGDLVSSSFVACDIFCSGVTYAITGKGVIIGGKMTCLKGMVFNSVGTESYTKTKLTLGDGAILAEEKLELEVEEAKITEEIARLIQTVGMLNNAKKKAGVLSKEHEDVLATAIRQRFKLSNDIKKIRKRVTDIDASFLNNINLFVEVRKTVWPGVTVRIGELSKKIDHKYDRCRIAVDNAGDIAITPITGSI
jgi:hypothetical protein